MSGNTEGSRSRLRNLRELLWMQLPITGLLLAMGFSIARLSDPDVLVAGVIHAPDGVAAPWWLLFALGTVSGGVMALIGGGAALLALPFCVIFLGYTGLSVTPTMLLVTLINPIGAWLGLRSEGMFNMQLALVFGCAAVVGGLVGPILRIKYLSDPTLFVGTVGIALIVAAAEVVRSGVRQRSEEQFIHARQTLIESLPAPASHVRVMYGGQTWNLSKWTCVIVGALIGVFSSAIGLGGGFLLVPFLSIFFRMPLQLVAAASIPYIIVLSCSGLAAYGMLAPVLGEAPISPAWAFGLFIAAGGVVGSWIGAKAQQSISHRVLNMILGLSVGITGLVYVAKAMLGI